MRYIIIGAGAVGGTVGGRLFEAGHDVVLIARGAHLGALRAGGLRLAAPEGAKVLAIPAAAGPDEVELRRDDVLVLATKSQDSVALLSEWARQPVAGGGVAAEELPLVCAQNGVANERFALRRFRNVYGMCVWLPATHLAPGVVVAHGAPQSGLLFVGRYPAGDDKTIGQIAADLAESRFVAPVTTDVMRWKYSKLLANLGNSIEALSGRPAGDAGREAAAELGKRVRAEGRAALDAAGIGYASLQEMRDARGDQVEARPVGETAHAGGSSWQSLTRGTGSIEADFLNGEIALLGREHGVPTPVNEALQVLANRAAAERWQPGAVSPGQILAMAAGDMAAGTVGCERR
ncbi:MAG TPA: 2-dehydropantoate 2-reductase N-terminal domain-containing protein [Trebonia sp.]|nr:2-dehydropantoate 2-reductase N-terminal domain-containing protein [Trebonia sp.]